MNVQSKLLSMVLGAAFLFPHYSVSHARPVEKPFWCPFIELVSQSRLVSLFEKNIQSKIVSGSSFSAGPASEKYQDFAKQAQVDAGTPQEFHGPAYKLIDSPVLNDLVSAIAFSDSIVINEKRLDNAPYGYQRAGIYHEAIHKKNNDSSLDTITELGTLLTVGILARYGLKHFNPNGKSKLAHVMGILIPSIAATYFVNSNYKKMCERRADIDGLYAANCAQCAYEFANHRHKSFEVDKNPVRFNGYLWPDEITAIANDLNGQGKSCAYHKENSVKKTLEESRSQVVEKA